MNAEVRIGLPSELTIKLPDDIKIDLTDEEDKILDELFGNGGRGLRGEIGTKLHDTLHHLAVAALNEYLSIILGKKVLRRASEIQEYRLFLLIICGFFEHTIPDDQEVCNFFQMTTSESRSLIRSVMSKYQHQLQVFIAKALGEVVDSAILENGDELYYEVIVNSKNLIDWLNSSLNGHDGTLEPVTKISGTAACYRISTSSYQELKKLLNKV